MPHVAMLHDVDPKQTILDAIGDISGLTVMKNLIVVATYMRPNKTAGGIHLPAEHLKEDLYQSKVGLIVAMGAGAFVDDEKWNFEHKFKVGDWIIFSPSSTKQISLNKVPCRYLSDTSVEMGVDTPDLVW